MLFDKNFVYHNAMNANMLRHLLVLMLLTIVPDLALAEILVTTWEDRGVAKMVCTNRDADGRDSDAVCPDSEVITYMGRVLVQNLWRAKNLDKLDQLYEQWGTGKERFGDGRWKSYFYGDGLFKYFQKQNTWEQDLALIKEWQRKKPNSEAARYVEVLLWRSYAWDARGNGFDNTVSQEGRALFIARLKMAQNALNAIDLANSKSAAPFLLKLLQLLDTGGSEAELLKVYDLGTKRFPEFHDIYFMMARYYDPLWGGSAKKYDQFARSVVEKTSGFEGKGMYARLLGQVDRNYDIPFKSELQKIPDWQMLKAGYLDLMKKYPGSIENTGKFIGLACQSNDSELYRSLRAKMVGYEQYAQVSESLDVCDRRHHWMPGK